LLNVERRVSLAIARPLPPTLAHAALLFVALCWIGEWAARTPMVQNHIPYQVYGINHPQIEIQFNLLERFVQEQGAPDCLILGSSQAFRSIDPIAFEHTFEAATNQPISCYNFGITGAQIRTTSMVVQLLFKEYPPRLVVVGTSFLDYTELRRQDIDERFTQNDWIRYRLGKFSLNGWLSEHSYAWRALTFLSYAAPHGMRYEAARREFKKWDGEIAPNGFATSPKAIDPTVPLQTAAVKNFQRQLGNYHLSEHDLAALEEIITRSQALGAQVIVVEMAYHQALLELKDAHGQPRMDKDRLQAFIAQVNDRLREIADKHGIPFIELDPTLPLPKNGWYDLYHLNRIGAEPYSRWLGERAAQTLDPLPPPLSGRNGK